MGGRGSAQQKKRRPQKGLEDYVRRTVYISYLDQSVSGSVSQLPGACHLRHLPSGRHLSPPQPQVTEEQLATFFVDCGKVVDCRVCGDPNSAMRFAFIEFTGEEAATKARGCKLALLGCSEELSMVAGVPKTISAPLIPKLFCRPWTRRAQSSAAHPSGYCHPRQRSCR